MTNQVLTMNGAELKTRLGGLGISPSWFALYLGVTMRTVVRWFDGDEVTVEVAQALEDLSDLTFDEMRRMVEEAEVDAIDQPIVLRTYRTDAKFVNEVGWPAEWHRMVVFRVRDHFVASGRPVTIDYVS